MDVRRCVGVAGVVGSLLVPVLVGVVWVLEFAGVWLFGFDRVISWCRVAIEI